MLTDFAMFGAVIFETLAVSSIFVFRRRSGRAETLPYRCPLYPLVPAVYVTFMAAVLANMFATKTVESLAGVGFVAAGALVYAFGFRKA